MKEITIALIGNPNVGKTSFFNALTGSHQYVANWPGVTVEKKTGSFKWNDYNVKVVDLPGIYTLNARSIDERIARDFLINERPDLVFNIVDGTNLKRNLYLTIQVIETGVKTVLILNQMDEVKNLDIKIDTRELSKRLGIPVIETIATKGVDIDSIMKSALSDSSRQIRYEIYPKELEDLFSSISRDIQNHDELKKFPPRWLAISLIEGDDFAKSIVRDHFAVPQEKDASLKIAKARYDFIDSVVKQVEQRPKEIWTITDALDHVFTHKILGIPIFISIMWMIFEFTFSISAPFSDLLSKGFDDLGSYAHLIPGWAGSLVGDGLISGVGSVLTFVPLIFFLFFSMGILEDSGYMSRAAFLIDRLMHRFRLSGRAFIPLLLGFGCNASAIMTTRTLEGEKERLISILINPFTTCSARLPIYAVISAAFFGAFGGFAIFSIYMISIVVALSMAIIFNFLLKNKETTPLIIEMPRYKTPTAKGLAIYTWSRGKHFLKKAGGIILGATVVVWLLSNLPFNAPIQDSLAAQIGKTIAPIFKPLGFDWHVTLALIFGGIAKEVTVTTLGTFANGNLEEFLGTILNPVSAYALMLFALLYIPCVATQATMKMETGSYKWPVFSVIWSLSLAYAVAFLFEKIAYLVI
ncbi:MAG: ferrous iron transport protein B [Mesoaciditoga sp.]|uniref:ferrous iron transport protein B n=1 Tax=Athalassotoga sp. TaxID=2022597 RepID=UPI000CB8F62B|nr:MAG: ferrous iron transport protein B [Mesoaciditoga sp.]HEU24189.1 ferrous iron transport protein B [Mesoaciditoga lauensis]